MRWAKHAKTIADGHLPPLCLKAACSHAARGGNLEVLEWLHNTGCPSGNALTMDVAAFGGHLEVVKWLHYHGCPWNNWSNPAEHSMEQEEIGVYDVFDSAVYGGHVEVLRWAREHGAPWVGDTMVCQVAAQGGHLEVLQWLREQGCQWNNWTSAYAARGRQLEVLQWVRENDRRGEAWNPSLVRNYVAGPRTQEVLTWLDQRTDP
jgi:hypothetical protein